MITENRDLARMIDERTEKKPDAINPLHYKSHPEGIECITVTRHADFNIGNAIKYCWRSTWPGSPITTAKMIQNYEKAIWYLRDEIEKLKAEQADGS